MASKKQLVRELNAKLSVEVVDLDTEVQYFLKIIKEMRYRLQSALADAEADTKKIAAITEPMRELMTMLDKAVSMEIKLDKSRKARQQKLTPEEYLQGTARFILGQPTSVRTGWLKEVIQKHQQIRDLEAGAYAVSQDFKSVLAENDDFNQDLSEPDKNDGN